MTDSQGDQGPVDQQIWLIERRFPKNENKSWKFLGWESEQKRANDYNSEPTPSTVEYRAVLMIRSTPERKATEEMETPKGWADVTEELNRANLAQAETIAEMERALGEINGIENPIMADDDFQEGCVHGFREAMEIVKAISVPALATREGSTG